MKFNIICIRELIFETMLYKCLRSISLMNEIYCGLADTDSCLSNRGCVCVRAGISVRRTHSLVVRRRKHWAATWRKQPCGQRAVRSQ